MSWHDHRRSQTESERLRERFELLPIHGREEHEQTNKITPKLWKGLFPGIIMSGIGSLLYYINFTSTVDLIKNNAQVIYVSDVVFLPLSVGLAIILTSLVDRFTKASPAACTIFCFMIGLFMFFFFSSKNPLIDVFERANYEKCVGAGRDTSPYRYRDLEQRWALKGYCGRRW